MGVGWTTKYCKIKYERNRAYGNYDRLDPSKTWQDQEATSARGKRTVEAYVTQLISPNPIDWDILGNIYRPDQKIPAATVRRLFKEEKFKKMIDDKLAEVLSKKGITKETVVQNNIDAYEMAKSKKDPSVMHKINGSFEEYLGMKMQKKTVTERIEMDMTHQIGETIEKEKEKRKIALERKTELPDTKD